MSKKKTQKLHLSKKVDGVIYSGFSIIEGTRKFHQTIYFDISSRYDSKEYKIGDEDLIKHFANVIFEELVREHTNRTLKQ